MVVPAPSARTWSDMQKKAIPEALVGETLGRITASQDRNPLAGVDFAVEAVTKKSRSSLISSANWIVL